MRLLNLKAALFALLILVGVSNESQACRRDPSFKPKKWAIEKAFKAADLVFNGTFKSGKKVEDGFETTFEVTKLYKGSTNSLPELKVETFPTNCDPYEFADRPQPQKWNYIANETENPSVYFYRLKTHDFLKLRAGAITSKKLDELSAGIHGKH